VFHGVSVGMVFYFPLYAPVAAYPRADEVESRTVRCARFDSWFAKRDCYMSQHCLCRSIEKRNGGVQLSLIHSRWSYDLKVLIASSSSSSSSSSDHSWVSKFRFEGLICVIRTDGLVVV
jgi:hypothetical protein